MRLGINIVDNAKLKYHLEKEICSLKVFIQTDSLFEALFDKMVDWLRKLNDNPFGSARVVSNPIFVIPLYLVEW